MKKKTSNFEKEPQTSFGKMTENVNVCGFLLTIILNVIILNLKIMYYNSGNILSSY